MPTQYSSVRVPLPEAAPLADLYGVQSDLRHVIATCAAAMSLAHDRHHDADVVESLVCAALIRYFRCFSASPRLGLRHDEIGRRNKALRESHAWFRALRSKFVAHAINPMEQFWASAALAVRDGVPQPISSLTHGSHRVLLGAVEAVSISRLAEHALVVVERRIRPEYRRVLKLVQSVPLQTVQEWAKRPYPRVRPTDVSTDRPQTRATSKHKSKQPGRAKGAP
jgi:hypothetical protein